VLELDAGLEFNPEHDEEFFSLLPERPRGLPDWKRVRKKAEPHLDSHCQFCGGGFSVCSAHLILRASG